MHKKDFFWEIGQKSGCSQRVVRLVVDNMIDVMKENLLKNEIIRFPGLFSVNAIDVPETVRHSGFKETYIMPQHKKLRFTISEKFKAELLGKTPKPEEDID